MNKKNTNFIENLACPCCKGELKILGKNKIKCLGSCKNSYDVEDGIPILLPKNLEAFKQLEADYHTNESDNFTELNMKHSYRVAYYHKKYLQSFNNLNKKALVVEVGGGDGLDALALLKKGFIVIQSDISIGMVKVAKKNTEVIARGQNAQYIVCDAEQLPCKESSLDAILIVAALHHLPSPQSFFNVAKRALKPGGLIIVGFEPNRWPYFTVYPILRMISKVMRLRKHFKHSETSVGDAETEGFTRKDFQNFTNEAGLEIVDLQRIWFLNGFIHTFFTSLNSKLSINSTIDLPLWLQKFLVFFDEILLKIPFMKNFCWHWTLVVKKTN